MRYSKAKPPADGLKRVDIAIPMLGYKNHVGIECRQGLIRTDAARHDGVQLPGLLDKANTGGGVRFEAKIVARKRLVDDAGLTWSVVESIPVHNSIKFGTREQERYVGFYRDSVRALARAGVRTICYNFMPVVYWTRTDLMYRLPSTGYAPRFDAVDFTAYDIFVLRPQTARRTTTRPGSPRRRLGSPSWARTASPGSSAI